MTTKFQQNKEANNLPRLKMARIDHELLLNIVEAQFFIHGLCSCLPRLEWKGCNRLTLCREAELALRDGKQGTFLTNKFSQVPEGIERPEMPQ